MSTQEYKYERVERIDVDRAGNAQLVDVGEDRGKEDPALNYQDKRPPALVAVPPALVPAASVGSVSGASVGSVPVIGESGRMAEYGETELLSHAASLGKFHESDQIIRHEGSRHRSEHEKTEISSHSSVGSLSRDVPLREVRESENIVLREGLPRRPELGVLPVGEFHESEQFVGREGSHHHVKRDAPVNLVSESHRETIRQLEPVEIKQQMVSEALQCVTF